LRDSAPKSEKKNELGKFGCPDGKCPCCSKRIDARRIVALSKTKDEDGVVTSNYLTDTKKPFIKQEVRETQEGNRNACARKILEDSLDGSVSSKLRAIMVELDAIWKLDPGSKVIIFSHYLGFLDMLEHQFKPSQIPFYRLDGTLTLKERSNVLDVFRTCSNSTKVGASDMDADPSSIQRGSVLLISMAAGGEGLNLVAASSCFIVEPWWTSAKEEQCVNRIHRIGQTADIVRVRKFIVNNSVEERILELQTRKKYVASEIYSDEGARSGEMGSARLGLEDFKLIFQGRADQTD
jgi:SNF2 family DNA or RNA helicase